METRKTCGIPFGLNLIEEIELEVFSIVAACILFTSVNIHVTLRIGSEVDEDAHLLGMSLHPVHSQFRLARVELPAILAGQPPRSPRALVDKLTWP